MNYSFEVLHEKQIMLSPQKKQKRLKIILFIKTGKRQYLFQEEDVCKTIAFVERGVCVNIQLMETGVSILYNLPLKDSDNFRSV